MPDPFAPKYTQRQRDALAFAYLDRGIRPARRVVELAAAGQLELDGEKLPAFTTNQNAVRDFAAKLRKTRDGKTASTLADAPPRDAIETLRRRLISMTDGCIAIEERRKPEDRDPERIRQLARATREIAALPGPSDPRPAAPGQRKDGKREGGETRGGLPGPLLADHRRTAGKAQPDPQTVPEPAQTHTNPHTTHRDTDHTTNPAHNAPTPNDKTAQEPPDDGTPSSVVRALAARLESDPPTGAFTRPAAG